MRLPAFVQGAETTLVTGTTTSKAFTSNVTAGNLIVVAIPSESRINSCVISDTLGTNFTFIGEAVASAHFVQVFYGVAIKDGANTITATVSPSTTNLGLMIHEYSGIDQSKPVISYRIQTSPGATSAANRSFGPVFNDVPYGLMFGAWATQGVGNVWTTDGLSTARNNGGLRSGSADQVIISKGTYALNGTQGSSTGDWAAVIVMFRGASQPITKRFGNWFNGFVQGIQFDAASNSGYQAASGNYTFNRTCNGTNRYLVVDIALLSAGQTVTSVTDDDGGGNVPMIFLGAKDTVTSLGRVESWGLAAPTTGTKAIRVILSGSIASSAMAVSYTGVHQTSPTEGFNSNQATNVGATDATVAVTSVANNCWIHAAVATGDTAITANQTSRNNVTGAGGSGADEDTGPITPAGATTMSYTNVGAAQTWAIVGFALRPISAASLVTTYLRGILRGGGIIPKKR